MKLSDAQIFVLHQLSKPYNQYEKHHPKDAYNYKTIEFLLKNKLVETYHYRNFLHGAIKLTDEGIRELLNNT